MKDDEILAKGYELVTAAATGMIELVELALEGGSDIHFQDDLALRSAAFTGNMNVVKYLVEKGANVHASGNEALLYAAKQKNDDVVEFLLSKGASIDAMMRAHRAEINEEVFETLDKFQSRKLREAFEKNFSKLPRPEQGGKFRLKPPPPSP